MQTYFTGNFLSAAALSAEQAPIEPPHALPPRSLSDDVLASLPASLLDGAAPSAEAPANEQQQQTFGLPSSLGSLFDVADSVRDSVPYAALHELGTSLHNAPGELHSNVPTSGLSSFGRSLKDAQSGLQSIPAIFFARGSVDSSVALSPQSKEASLNAELIASLPSSLIDTVSTELQRHDPRQGIVRPADQIGVSSMAREENSLKNLSDDDVAHGAERWWRERVMPWSPSDYIGGIGSYPIEGDRMRPPLFVKGAGDVDEVSINDIDQQAIGDCYFLGSLAAVARQDPQRIKDMVVDHGDGTYTVTFKERIAYTAPPQYMDRPITVTGDFPGGLNGAGHAAGADVTKQKTVEIWPLVFEKAFGQYLSTKNPYGTLDVVGTFEMAQFALEAITGHPVKADGVRDISQMGASNPIYLGPPAKSFDELLSDFQAGEAITLCTDANERTLIPGHCYAVDNVYTDADGKQWVQLYNPWGTDHPGPIPFEDLKTQRMITTDSIGPFWL